jgi:hypothetical protein
MDHDQHDPDQEQNPGNLGCTAATPAKFKAPAINPTTKNISA